MIEWREDDIADQSGRVVIVTGGANGLGGEVARALALKGARVIAAARNQKNGERLLQQVRALLPSADLRFEPLDLADQASIKDFSARVAAVEPKLDVLINNAGVAMPPARCETKEGFELQFGVNYLGHFLLTAELLPLLRRASAPRVVNVSSLAHLNGAMNFDDLNAKRRYDAPAGYAQSKLALMLFARELQRKSVAQSWGILANAAHPGWSNTDLGSNGRKAAGWTKPNFVELTMRVLGPVVGQTPAQGALPLLYAAVDPQARDGYYGPNGMFGLSGYPADAKRARAAYDDAAAARLWDESTALTGAIWPN